MTKHRFGRRAAIVLLPVSRLLLRLYWRTLRPAGTAGAEHLDAVVTSGQPFILCSWHEMQLLSLPYLARIRDRGVALASLVSPSEDGDIAARFGRGLGIGIVRGSSSRTGAQALRNLYLEIAHRKTSLALTVDGPRGPRRRFKPGAVLLAQTTGAPILPFVFEATSAWRLRSWDRFVIPKPGARIAYAFGEPVPVGRDIASTSGDGLEETGRRLEAAMAELSEQARRRLGEASSDAVQV